mmetsp:Transcript_41974/g.67512  ORF Transcript_41974/g.67512 Transcript_41974/m.67512 type:complete len:215 (-) Transcript_41974:1723-2367(-)
MRATCTPHSSPLSSAITLLMLPLFFIDTHSYRHGDLVTVLKRSQYQGMKTAWSEMNGNLAPHFAVDRTIRIDPMFEIQKQTASQYKTHDAFKISFSFINERFITPWLTVTDGRGHYLHNIYFTFVYAGHHLKSVRVDSDYHPDESLKVPPDHVNLIYRWETDVEVDTHTGFTTLTALTCLGTLTALGLVVKTSLVHDVNQNARRTPKKSSRRPY